MFANMGKGQRRITATSLWIFSMNNECGYPFNVVRHFHVCIAAYHSADLTNYLFSARRQHHSRHSSCCLLVLNLAQSLRVRRPGVLGQGMSPQM